MRKLNRKGFTLVELLAVIVILAIVVGIALTTVLPTLKKSRQEAFDLTANTVADYVEKQYQLSLLNSDAPTIEFGTSTAPHTITANEYKAAGVKADNYRAGTWYVDSNTGRACVTLTAATNTNPNETTGKAGEYYDAGTGEGTNDVATSSGCH